jgi:hypothetical protein
MTVRKAEPKDYPAIRELAKTSNFPFPDVESPTIEGCDVVVDEDGKIIMAVVAERICQILLVAGEFEHPAAKLAAIRMVQEQDGHVLKELRYNHIEAFVEPSLAKRFGRRLEKSLGWSKNWPSWSLKL